MGVRGIDMKKYIVISFGLFVILLLLFYKQYQFMIVALVGGLVLVALLALSKSRIAGRWRKSPDFLKNDTRNYSYIKLGYGPIGEIDDSLDLTQEYSNLYSDFLVLKRFYSLLKKDGTIVINMNPTKYYMFYDKPSIFSLCMLHPVTLLELGKFYYIYEEVFGEILNPIAYLLKKIGRNRQIQDTHICNWRLMQEIEEFCIARHLRIEWYIMGKRI